MADKLEDMPGLKERELQDLGPCIICGKAHLDPTAGSLTFYKVSVSRALFNQAALRRRVGLEMVLGGAGMLAQAMGPDEDLATVFAGPVESFVHETCALRINHLLQLMPEKKSAAEGQK